MAILSGAELLLPDPPAWRAWLEEHHADTPAVWLVLTKKGGTLTSLTWQTALDEALCFGWIDGQARRRDEQSSFQRFTPRGPKSRWSQRNVEHIDRLEREGRMTAAGRAAVEAAKADGRWEAAYAGPATAETPPDLLAAIVAVPAAQAMYDVLTSQNRFALYHRITSLKTEAARTRKIEEYVAMLARHETIHPQKRQPER
ncbi:YdeI/OmpD-associated family protein [Nocardioides sp.]|uniref:YdeI/OmpD-associated family protein n=1 Tax=Nocardioides sp. TaxID=35761 RepID=UPI0019CC9CA3|nr:YdeI/OmpD-associated family protein [Nocardioides sp.]MBC7277301.1 YdeI/OmpD-associated family protein [Nocardioides sp.]